MSDAVKLLVPVEGEYRALATEVGRKYTELAGGSPADAGQAADALASALLNTTKSAAADASVLVTFEQEAGRVAMRVDCGAASATVRQSIPERKPS